MPASTYHAGLATLWNVKRVKCRTRYNTPKLLEASSIGLAGWFHVLGLIDSGWTR